MDELPQRRPGGSSKGPPAARRSPPHPPMRREHSGRPPDERPDTHAVLERIERSAARETAAESLVRRAKIGDDLAFAELYIAFFDRVYRYLLIALKNPDDAQEVAQDVFVRALATIDRYEPERGDFRDWLFSMVRSQAIDHLRKGRRSDTIDPAELPPGVATMAERATTLLDRLDPEAGVRGIIESLPEAQRRVIALRFVFELNATEIADTLGSTPDAVRHVQHRALKTLGAALRPRPAT